MILVNLVPFSICYQTAHLLSNHEQTMSKLSDQLDPNTDRIIKNILLATHNLPFLLVNMMITSDWLDFTAILIVANSLNCMLLENVFMEGVMQVPQFLIKNSFTMMAMIIVFALFEKNKKEHYIINLTNAKTKK